jgi:hypothetical protein
VKQKGVNCSICMIDARTEVTFYLKHMRTAEGDLCPVAQQVSTAMAWLELNPLFTKDRSPLASGQHDPCFDRLLARIVSTMPSPIGVGRSFDAI